MDDTVDAPVGGVDLVDQRAESPLVAHVHFEIAHRGSRALQPSQRPADLAVLQETLIGAFHARQAHRLSGAPHPFHERRLDRLRRGQIPGRGRLLGRRDGRTPGEEEGRTVALGQLRRDLGGDAARPARQEHDRVSIDRDRSRRVADDRRGAHAKRHAAAAGTADLLLLIVRGDLPQQEIGSRFSPGARIEIDRPAARRRPVERHALEVSGDPALPRERRIGGAVSGIASHGRSAEDERAPRLAGLQIARRGADQEVERFHLETHPVPPRLQIDRLEIGAAAQRQQMGDPLDSPLAPPDGVDDLLDLSLDGEIRLVVLPGTGHDHSAVRPEDGHVPALAPDPFREGPRHARLVVGQEGDLPGGERVRRSGREWRLDRDDAEARDILELRRAGRGDAVRRRRDDLGSRPARRAGCAGDRRCGRLHGVVADQGPFEPVDHAAQRLRGREPLHRSRIDRTLGRQERALQGAEDLDAFDRIDPQIRFHVDVETEHVGRVAGALADDLEHLPLHAPVVGGARRGSRRVGDGGGRGLGLDGRAGARSELGWRKCSGRRVHGEGAGDGGGRAQGGLQGR